MSAYVVSTAHINALVNFAVREKINYYVNQKRIEITRENAEEIGQILFDENYRSVEGHYEDRTKGHFGSAPTFKFKGTLPLPALTILKLVNCLNYQSCESDDWNTTIAFDILSLIKDEAITKLPGYNEAPWGI